jgi:hypothetical protein
MRWDLVAGHVPRGFLGAVGRLEEVQLILIVAEPGDPRAGDVFYDEGTPAERLIEDVVRRIHYCFTEAPGQFHSNVRYLLDRAWPNLDFDRQLRRVWITESVLCSARFTTGPVPAAFWRACVNDYLEAQLALMPQAVVAALGGKAQKRTAHLGRTILPAFAAGKPGCFQRGAKPSWEAVASAVRRAFS